jgi:hypothetical protein
MHPLNQTVRAFVCICVLSFAFLFIPIGTHRNQETHSLILDDHISPFQCRKAYALRFSWVFSSHADEPILRSWNDLGIRVMNQAMVDHATPEIRDALHVIGDPVNQPCLFFCSAGKDRTGLIAALLLGIAGASKRAIVDDYALTHPPAKMIDAMIAFGLMKKEFWEAQDEVMLDLLDYIDVKYGSVTQYLLKSGVETRQLHQSLTAASNCSA